MQAITFEKTGDPREVLSLSERPVPNIKEDEVLIRMTGASINPGDALFIGNLYPEPKRPVFPHQIAGNHGMGVIERPGKDSRWKQGTVVGFSYYNTWAEYAAVPSEWLIELPAGYPLAAGSQMVNLVTAWDLLEQAGVKGGDWLVITAGNSAVSGLVTQFATHRGVRVISIVREKKQISANADVTVELNTLQSNIRDNILEITGGKGIKGIVDNVGGPVTGDLVRSLVPGGRLIINGGQSPERMELHNFDVLLSLVEIKAHVYRYFFTPPQPADAAMLGEIIRLSQQDSFRLPVGGIHPLRDYRQAILEGLFQPANGKHIFGM